MTQIPIESVSLMMLNVGKARHNADWNWRDVNSPFTRIFLPTEGEALLHLPERTQRLSPGHLYIIPAYTTHSYECSGQFTHYYLHVYETFKTEMSLIDFYEFPTEIEAERDTEFLFNIMCNRYTDARLPESDPKAYDNLQQTENYMHRYRDMPLWQKMELRGIMLMITSQFVRNAKPRVWTLDERMKKVLAHIHQHIDQEADTSALADVACVSRNYLIRLFQRELGVSPIQYVNKKKMERAQLLLYTTDMPVKEVAYALGFSDHSYFIRLFRKLIGTTPLDYRRSIK